MDCVHCREESKYKCPICRQPYCSVACYKLHKEKKCEAPSQQPQITEEYSKPYDFPTEDTVPMQKLKLLEHSKEIRKCLENPHVRDILTLLDKSSHPDILIDEYMQEPIFIEFVDACLSIVQPEE